MTLDALIRGAPKTQPVGSATAIPATGATEEGGKAGTVARVATIAVAAPRNAKTEGKAPANLDEALRTACEGAGISPEVFRSLLSPEDLDDIAAGDIHPKTLKAYAVSFAARQAQPDLSR